MEHGEAIRTLEALIRRVEQTMAGFSPGTAQHSLQKNRLGALSVARTLTGGGAVSRPAAAEALAPLRSLIGKSEKAREKLRPGVWQHAMLSRNLAALRLALPLVEAAADEKGLGAGGTE